MTINIVYYKQLVRDIQQEAIDAFQMHEPIQKITKTFVKAIDTVLIELFHAAHEINHQFLLLAIGGYGRRELQLHSDIDLLILYQEKPTLQEQQCIEQFIQSCWDIGFEISHQLTHPTDCATLAEQDITIISSLLDMRPLCGNLDLQEELLYLIHPAHMWSSLSFFTAKKEEQHLRYTKYNETAYNLEPNVKNGPGGLRDIHILTHIAKRHFKVKKLSDGIMHGFLTDKEYEELIHCRRFLWRVRFALHWLSQKKEDKLLFDYQTKIAPFLDYKDTENTLAIELLMKDYFKIIKRTRELNDILLQWFNEVIVSNTYQLVHLDHSFQLANQYIETKHPFVFQDHPEKLLTLFLWMTKIPEIQGVRANTIRSIHQSIYLMNHAFRTNKVHNQLFMQIFKSPNGPYHALRHMSRYGVLGHYLPCFQHIIGQMQYDLFHVYTVDQHALFVIRNLTRFLEPVQRAQFPLCVRLMQSIPKCEILYLSALFHDIAKGRGGDHSELGAIEAERFAEQHHLETNDRLLLVWLVEHHLLMSHTAQRKDIYDPQIIAEFCRQLPHSGYLDYLYLLTVADICATNPKLWNTWKDSLLKELYYAVKLAMHQDEKEFSDTTLIKERQEAALALLTTEPDIPMFLQNENHSKPHIWKEQEDINVIHSLWQQLNPRYFMHETPNTIAYHTKAILTATGYPLVLIQPHHTAVAMELFIYMPHQDARFAITTAILSNCHVTIQEANILTCAHGFDLDTYIISDEENHTSISTEKIKLIQETLETHLNQQKIPRIIKRRRLQEHAHFNFTPQITFQQMSQPSYTQLLFITSDRPGLLAHISQVFLQHNIHVHLAKIATIGERAEDTFSLSHENNQPLTLKTQEALERALNELN